MKPHRLLSNPFPPALAALTLALSAQTLHAQFAYRQKNLVSDIPGLAQRTDPNLVNPWGISTSAGSPFWVSDNGTGKSTLYNTAGNPLGLVVSVPDGSGAPGAPTGQVFNGTGAFNGDLFLFATENGTIAGWRGALGTTAETVVNHSADGAVYKGLAIAGIGANTYLYAADFANNHIEVVPSTGAPALSGSFVDPTLPAGYAPFNIQNIGGSLYVAYAQTQSGSTDEHDGPGLGFVDKYDLNGNFLMRVASTGVLNAPWGLALAPTSFGQFGGDLLVGNFGDGTINAFDPTTGDLLGSLKDDHGNPLMIDGLWGLKFGNGGNGGKLNTLYFAAGLDSEAHGLFGSITPVPEPATTGAMAALGLLTLCVIARRRHRNPALGSTAVTESA